MSARTLGGRRSSIPAHSRGLRVFATKRVNQRTGFVLMRTSTPPFPTRRKARHCPVTLCRHCAPPRVSESSCGENSTISSAHPAYRSAKSSAHPPTSHTTRRRPAPARTAFSMGVASSTSPKCPGMNTTTAPPPSPAGARPYRRSRASKKR